MFLTEIFHRVLGAPRIHRSCANGFVSTLPGITTLHDITQYVSESHSQSPYNKRLKFAVFATLSSAAIEKFASKECIGVRNLEEEVKIEKVHYKKIFVIYILGN